MRQKIKNVGTFTHGPRQGFISMVKERLDCAQWTFSAGRKLYAAERREVEKVLSYLGKSGVTFDRMKVDYWTGHEWPNIWPRLEALDDIGGDGGDMVEAVAGHMANRLAKWRIAHLVKRGVWKKLPDDSAGVVYAIKPKEE